MLNIDAAAKYTQLGYEVTQRSLYDLALKGILRFLIKERALLPGVVLVPLRIATKLSMTKSESILEN